jgi:hypothetical protein
VSDNGNNGARSNSSSLAQNILAAVVPVVVAILAGLYITQSQNVEALGKDNVKVQTLVAAELDLDKKIEADLASISSKYIDEQVAIQVLRGDEQVATDAISRLKDDLDRSRQDHIADIADVRKRLEEVEKTFAPIRGNSTGH